MPPSPFPCYIGPADTLARFSHALPFEMAFAVRFPIVMTIKGFPQLADDILAAAIDLPRCIWIGAHAASMIAALSARSSDLDLRSSRAGISSLRNVAAVVGHGDLVELGDQFA